MQQYAALALCVLAAWGAGAWSVLHGRLTGTNDGSMPALGLEASGKKIDVAFIELIRWQDGKAVQAMPFMNSMEMAMQLGLLAQPATP